MFKEARSFNQNIGKWKTGNVKIMSHMFEGARSFNQDIGLWKTERVTSMSHMFEGAQSFNQDIGTWETSNVTNMSHMFKEARSFNQNIGTWDTSNVTNMTDMFKEARSFNQNIGTWKTGNVRDMSAMFFNATSFNQDIGTWETGNVENMTRMFQRATSFNKNIGTWDTKNVITMNYMFYYAISFNQDIRKWKTGKVENMSQMFAKAKLFNQKIGTWETGNVENMSYMFEGATSFNQNIGTWETGNVENMSYMFKGATSFNQEIGTWDIGNVGDITDMFKGATSFSKETPKCSSIISAPYDEGPSRISSEVHMMIPTIESTTTFTGGETLVGMMYLLYKYPEYCVVIPEIMSSSSYLLSPKYQDRWNEVQLCWNELLEDFDIPYGLWDSIKECLNKKPKPNFIVIPFVFLCKYNIGHHSNCLIYDSNTKELERFDPNGTSINECYNPPYLEKKLKYLFNSNVQEGMIEKVYAPLSFCPKRSFQALQGSEGKEKPGDPGGFCTAWAAWYADTRLANPNKTRKQVVEMGLKKFEDEPGLMTQYIRSYSVFITKAEELLKKSNNPASVFRLLIEKSKYT
jgi:surface protein